MKQRRQSAITPSTGTPALSPKAGKTHPTPLDETMLKQVSGGVRAPVTNTPRGTW
jgi:hypothetical protein